MNISILDFTVIVTGGTGTATVNAQGVTVLPPCEVRRISIVPERETDAYAISVKDGHPLYYESGITGSWPILLNAPTTQPLSVTITGTDGTYSVRIWLKS